jgi:osmotically-inducible protein OsmY
MIGISLRTSALVAALAGAMLMSACVPLVLGGAVVGGSLVASDRRSSGTQIDDQAIELKASNRVNDLLGRDRGHVSVVSYNRVVLLTGEVPTEEDKVNIEQAVAKVDNVRSTVNELQPGFSSSLRSRSNDTLITSKVKATLIDAGDVNSNAFKIITERGTVFLMGRVTEQEANRVVDLTRSISGVQKVVRVFEIITEAELAELSPQTAPRPPAGASAPNPVTATARP